MKYYRIQENSRFIGRKPGWSRLAQIHSQNVSSIIVIHGRRRVGKTELIEQFFRKENVLKFEGLQFRTKPQSPKKQQQRQIEECLRLLGQYTSLENIYKNVVCKNWSEFFELLSPHVSHKPTVLYFEELQWLSAFDEEFLARLKPFWDNSWRHNNGLRVVFSGSSPSFLVRQFMSDKALYNRSTQIIGLGPFSLNEIDLFLGKAGFKEKIIAACCVEGIPEYLKQISKQHSILDSLYRESFSKYGFLLEEFSKIFVSSFSDHSHYKDTIKFRCAERFMSRNELVAKLSPNSTLGGNFSKMLEDLEACGFIESYSPLHLSEGRNLTRYCIRDEYLNFYQNFIRPIEKEIRNGAFEKNHKLALNITNLIPSWAFLLNVGAAITIDLLRKF